MKTRYCTLSCVVHTVAGLEIKKNPASLVSHLEMMSEHSLVAAANMLVTFATMLVAVPSRVIIKCISCNMHVHVGVH